MSAPVSSSRFSLKYFVTLLAVAAGLSYASDVVASDDHGHAAKADAKTEAKAEAKAEPKAKPSAKDEAKEGSKAGAKSEAKTEAKGDSSVSMAELRDLIDQKISEVRTRQTTAPVVRLQARSPKPSPRAPKELLALAQPAAHAGAVNPNGHDVHWAYQGDTGPDSWGRLKPEFQQCMVGKRQSPIDIREGIPVELDPIQFDYKSTFFRVIDNGHTVQVNVEPGNSISVLGRRYDLIQFHFHRPSEERINGRQFDMVAHLVHKDLEGNIAVVAVLLEQGKAHPLVQQVWNNLPLEKNTEQAAMPPMDLAQLLPEKRQYYTYMGSLTTPPCSEGVLWMVLKQPVGLSREQVSVFSRLYPMNARPIQSTSGRLIKDGQ